MLSCITISYNGHNFFYLPYGILSLNEKWACSCLQISYQRNIPDSELHSNYTPSFQVWNFLILQPREKRQMIHFWVSIQGAALAGNQNVWRNTVGAFNPMFSVRITAHAWIARIMKVLKIKKQFAALPRSMLSLCRISRIML